MPAVLLVVFFLFFFHLFLNADAKDSTGKVENQTLQECKNTPPEEPTF